MAFGSPSFDASVCDCKHSNVVDHECSGTVLDVNSRSCITSFILGLTTDNTHTMISANAAHVLDAQNEVDMLGNILLVRSSTLVAQELYITSESLIALPDDDIVKTDVPVDILHGSSSLEGTGSVASNAKQTLHVSNRTVIVIPPHASK